MSSRENIKENLNIILYFQVHQPRRLNAVNFFEIRQKPEYFNDALNETIVRRVATGCYLPVNELLLQLIEENPGIKIVFSLSGTVAEQLERFAPEALDSFRKLAQTGQVEFLAETYYHSLASLIGGDEFEIQVFQHVEKMYELFGVKPSVFRNTELIYNNDIGRRVAMMGFRGIFTEGHETLLGNRSPHGLFHHPELTHLNIFLRNYRLSDDIAFRFLQNGAPLKLDQYLSWLNGIPGTERLVNLAMDYETFGEHHKGETGILNFLGGLLRAISNSSHITMALPSEVAGTIPSEPLSVEKTISWADQERDLTAWLGNDIQRDAFSSVMKLDKEVKNLANPELVRCWRYLQTSDHFYYMSLKTDNDGSVHSYFSPFPSSYEAFISFMNVVTHLTLQINKAKEQPVHDDSDLAAREAERQETKASTPIWVMNLESVPLGNVPEAHD